MKEAKTENKLWTILKKIGNKLLYLLMFGVFVVVVIGVQYYCWGWIIDNVPAKERGTFGDMFGSVNTLFSGLAFAGVLFTIVLQGWELSATRSELKLSREAHQQSKLLMDEQLNVLKKTLDIEQVRLDQQFLPIFVPDIPIGHGSTGVYSKTGEYMQWIKNRGKPIVTVMIEKMYSMEGDRFSQELIPFVDSDERFGFREFTEEYGEPLKYHAITFFTLDGRMWKTVLNSYYNEKGRLLCSVGEFEEMKKINS